MTNTLLTSMCVAFSAKEQSSIVVGHGVGFAVGICIAATVLVAVPVFCFIFWKRKHTRNRKHTRKRKNTKKRKNRETGMVNAANNY